MIRQLVAAVAVAIALSGCVAPGQYPAGSVGQINRTVAAKVVSARIVSVSGTTGVGTAAGVGAGAVAGSAMGSGNRAGALGAIGGAVVGGLVGAAIESNATKATAMEYVVETFNGNLMTIVQGTEAQFAVGTKVLVLYGSPSRLIPDPRG